VKLQGVSTTACADLQSFQEAEALLACVVRYVHITVLSPFRQPLILLRQADVVFGLLCCTQCRSGQKGSNEAGAPSERTPTPGTVPHGMPALLTHSLLLVCMENIFIRPAIYSIMGCWLAGAPQTAQYRLAKSRAPLDSPAGALQRCALLPKLEDFLAAECAARAATAIIAASMPAAQSSPVEGENAPSTHREAARPGSLRSVQAIEQLMLAAGSFQDIPS